LETNKNTSRPDGFTAAGRDFLFLELREVVTILLAVEAGTVFVDTFQFSVATDVRLGVIFLQTAQEGDEGCPLRFAS
jgi:hypothetical protein